MNASQTLTGKTAVVTGAGIYSFAPIEEIAEEHFHRHFAIKAT